MTREVPLWEVQHLMRNFEPSSDGRETYVKGDVKVSSIYDALSELEYRKKHDFGVKLDEGDEKRILDNSIERVINASIQVAQAAETNRIHGYGIEELASTNWQDWEDLKPLTVKIWNSLRNSIFEWRQEQSRSDGKSEQS